MVKDQIIKLYNKLKNCEYTKIVTIEKNDKTPHCVFCGKDLHDNEWCYVSFPQKEFACNSPECTENGQVNGINTGYTLSKLSNKYRQYTNVFPILLKFENREVDQE